MNTLQTMQTPYERTAVALDGSDVRLLLELKGGGFALFELPPCKTSIAVAHHTVDEIWYIIGGRGEMWRKLGDVEEMVKLEVGTCLTIPVGTHFQWRSLGTEPLAILGASMPPWPGEQEPYRVECVWKPTVESSTMRTGSARRSDRHNNSREWTPRLQPSPCSGPRSEPLSSQPIDTDIPRS